MNNNNKNGIPPEAMQEMLQGIAQKMGKSPDLLRQELESNGPPEELRKLLGDRQKLAEVLASPQIQELLRQLGKK